MRTGGFPRVIVSLGAVAALALPAPLLAQASSTSSGQGYPAKPVRVIVPFPAGGGTDVQAGVLFKDMSEQLRQIFIIDNRSGAGGLVGAEVVVNSPAGGYTLLLTTATIEREALTAIGDSPEEFGAHMKREIARYAEIIRKGNITVQ